MAVSELYTYGITACTAVACGGHVIHHQAVQEHNWGVSNRWTGLLSGLIYFGRFVIIHIIELSVFFVSAASTTATNYNNAYM